VLVKYLDPNLWNNWNLGYPISQKIIMKNLCPYLLIEDNPIKFEPQRLLNEDYKKEKKIITSLLQVNNDVAL